MKKNRKIYAVIDTNVLVSSLFLNKSLSNPLLIIQSVLNGNITPLYSEEIIDEYKEVLSRNKFRFKPDDIRNLISVFYEFGIDTPRTGISGEVFPDSDDIVFYEVAMSVEDAYLVTGNTKHFPVKTFVVTPAQMVQILMENGLL